MAIAGVRRRRSGMRRLLPLVIGLPFAALAVSAGCWQLAPSDTSPGTSGLIAVASRSVESLPVSGAAPATSVDAHAVEADQAGIRAGVGARGVAAPAGLPAVARPRPVIPA